MQQLPTTAVPAQATTPQVPSAAECLCIGVPYDTTACACQAPVPRPQYQPHPLQLAAPPHATCLTQPLPLPPPHCTCALAHAIRLTADFAGALRRMTGIQAQAGTYPRTPCRLAPCSVHQPSQRTPSSSQSLAVCFRCAASCKPSCPCPSACASRSRPRPRHRQRRWSRCRGQGLLLHGRASCIGKCTNQYAEVSMLLRCKGHLVLDGRCANGCRDDTLRVVVLWKAPCWTLPTANTSNGVFSGRVPLLMRHRLLRVPDCCSRALIASCRSSLRVRGKQRGNQTSTMWR
jgi:hypothetical protein